MHKQAQKMIDSDDMGGLKKNIESLKKSRQYDEVTNIYDELYAKYCENGKQSSDRALWMLMDEGVFCEDIGRYERADVIFRLCYNTSADNTRVHIKAALKCANIAAYNGDTESAKKYIDEAVDMAVKCYGEDDLQTLDEFYRVLRIYRDRNRDSEVLPMYERLVSGYFDNYGPQYKCMIRSTLIILIKLKTLRRSFVNAGDMLRHWSL